MEPESSHWISERAHEGAPGLNSPEMANRQVVIEVPETILLAEKTDEEAFAREIQVLAAVKLYELGRLSSGRAAELAGMGRVEFLLSLPRYKVFPFEAELRDLEDHVA
jgi:predicted HTH domain antitoxin